MERNLFLLILLLTPFFGGDQFVFWANFSTKDHVLVGQEFSISPLMVELSNVGEEICQIDSKKSNNISTYEYLKSNKEKLLDCFLSNGAKIYDTSINNSMMASTNSHLTIIPIRFKVRINTDFSTIIMLEK